MKSVNITVVIHENYLNTLFGFFHLSRKNLFQNTHETGGKKRECNIPHTCNLPLHKPNQANEKTAPELRFRKLFRSLFAKKPCSGAAVPKKQCPVRLLGAAHLHTAPNTREFKGTRVTKSYTLSCSSD